MKEFIKNFLKNRGKMIVPYDEYRLKMDLIGNKWLKDRPIKTVIDVGASDGGFAKKTRLLFPTATIHSVEALPDSYAKLINRFASDPNFVAYNTAVSDQVGTIDFFLCQDNTGSSSMLEMSDIHKTAYPSTQKNTKLTVPTTTLDKLLVDVKLDKEVMLKIDVQGAELIVLRGAEETLKKTTIVFAEVNFQELYKDCVLFDELYAFLRGYGFRLGGVENVSQDTNDGKFLQADMYFIK